MPQNRPLRKYFHWTPPTPGPGSFEDQQLLLRQRGEVVPAMELTELYQCHGTRDALGEAFRRQRWQRGTDFGRGSQHQQVIFGDATSITSVGGGPVGLGWPGPMVRKRKNTGIHSILRAPSKSINIPPFFKYPPVLGACVAHPRRTLPGGHSLPARDSNFARH